jgi:hypothetical protein
MRWSPTPGRPTNTHTRTIASCSHWVYVERARGLAVLVFLEEHSTLDCIHRQCNSCKSTGAKSIPGIDSLLTAASRAARGKKLETFMLATSRQKRLTDWAKGRRKVIDRLNERRNGLRVARENSSRNEGGAVGGGIQKKRNTDNRSWSVLIYPSQVPGWTHTTHVYRPQHLSSPCSITSKHPPSGPAACIS